ncbi:MAG TPA: ABC transporter permease, partial [Chitinophagaceae bacterium]|nr:ABC transporter permease [Chitinophagaceae bacterium]
MNFLFAWRYFNAKKSTNAINIIAWISVLAMGTGTAALIILLSVFNGFEDLVKSLYADFYTDLRVSAASGKVIQLTNQQKQKITGWPGISAVSLTIEEKAMLQNGDFRATVLVKGVDENYQKVTNVAGRLVRGKYLLGDADKPAVVLGVGVENALGTESDRAILPLTVYLPRRGMNSIEYGDPLQSLSADNIVTAGSFAIQQDFDNNYIITNIGFVKRMLGLRPDEYGSVEIAISNKEEAEKIKKELQQFLGKNYTVQTMYEQNRSLYTTMR